MKRDERGLTAQWRKKREKGRRKQREEEKNCSTGEFFHRAHERDEEEIPHEMARKREKKRERAEKSESDGEEGGAMEDDCGDGEKNFFSPSRACKREGTERKRDDTRKREE